MDTKTIQAYSIFLAFVNGFICLFVGLTDFIENKDIVLLFLGMGLFFLGINELSSLYESYLEYKESNRNKEFVVYEIMANTLGIKILLRVLGEILFGCFLILLYILLKLGIAYSV